MKRTTVDLPDELTRQLKIRAIETGKTLKEIITEAVTQYLKGGANNGERHF